MKKPYKNYTKEFLLSKLIEASELLGHSPSQRNIEELPGFPSRCAYRNHFETFSKAMEIAGLPLLSTGSGSPNHPYGSKFCPKYQLRKQSRKYSEHNPKPRINKKPRPINENLRLACSKKHLRLRFRVFERDNFTCKYCGRTVNDGANLVIDHVIPFSKGGKTKLENLVTSCFECNMGKNDVIINFNPIKKKEPAKG